MTSARIDLIFPRFKLLSGAERAILGLAEAMSNAGHSPRIVCHQFDKSCESRLVSGVELVCSGRRLDWTPNRYLNAAFDYMRAFQLRACLNPKADIQILFGPALPLIVNLRKLTRSKAVVLYYCWEPPRVLYQDRQIVLSRLGWLSRFMSFALRTYTVWDRYMVALTDGVCTSSQFAAKRIQECYGRPATPVTLGVDRFRLRKVVNNVPDIPPVLLTVNYLHPRKRVDLIIEAVAMCGRAMSPGEKPKLVIVGDGPERQSLEELVVRLGLSGRVRFAGFVPDDELPRYYGLATCYLHAGVEESFGLSVIEASYCGRPVVAVDEAGIKETVEHGVTGYRVPATAADLATAIDRILERLDHGRSLGQAGHRRIEARYRWEQGVVDVMKLAQDVKVWH